MARNEAHTLEHEGVRYENTDVESRRLIIVGFSILGAMWLFALALFVGYRVVQERTPVDFTTTLPPEPRLQVSPRGDYAKELAYENQQLHSYSWVDRDRGIVAIPIDRAMEIIAKRGIPPQKAPPELKLYPPRAGSRETGLRQ